MGGPAQRGGVTSMGAIVKWAPEHEQELVRLFQTKFEDAYFLSHSLIGSMLKKSRPAVVGKIHRLKLTRDPTVPCKGVDGIIIDPQRVAAVPAPPPPMAVAASRGLRAPRPSRASVSMRRRPTRSSYRKSGRILADFRLVTSARRDFTSVATRSGRRSPTATATLGSATFR